MTEKDIEKASERLSLFRGLPATEPHTSWDALVAAYNLALQTYTATNGFEGWPDSGEKSLAVSALKEAFLPGLGNRLTINRTLNALDIFATFFLKHYHTNQPRDGAKCKG